MKKLLTILILLLAVASQGIADERPLQIWPETSYSLTWSEYCINDIFSNVTTNATLKFTYTSDSGSPQLQVWHKDSDYNGTQMNVTTNTELSTFEVTVSTDTELDDIKARGIYIKGQDATITQISYTPSGGEATTIWPETAYALSWTERTLLTSAMSSLATGDGIQVTFTKSADSPQMQLWHKNSSYEGTEFFGDDITEPSFVVIPTETAITDINARGLTIKGQNATVTKIEAVTMCSLAVTSSNESHGTASVETDASCDDKYLSGISVKVKAEAVDGFRFVNWTDDNNSSTQVSTDAEYTFTITENTSLTANFIQQFTVTASSADEGKGSVAITNADANNKYDAGSTVTVTATTASALYEFDKWTKAGDDTWNASDAASTNPLSISELAADWTLTASFKEKTKDTPEISLSAFSAGDEATLTAGVFTTTANEKTISQWIGENSGVTGNKLVVKFAGAPTGEEGQSVKVAVQYIATEYEEANAYPDANNIAVVDLNNTKYIKSIYIQLAKPGSVTVNSVALDPLYTITATSASNTQGSAVVSTDPTSDGKYAYGTEVTVTATPEQGYSFSQWKVNDTSVSTNASYTFTATEDIALTAEFVVGKTVQTLKTATQKMVNETVGTKVLIANSAFANVSAGDVITVNMSEVATSGAFIVLKENSSGTSLFGSNYSSALTSGQTSFTHTLTADDMTLLTGDNKALCITGEGFTCGNITIASAGNITADAAHTTMYVLSVTQPAAGGTIQIGGTDAVAQKAYDNGSQVTLTATPTSGYELSKWSDGTNELEAESDGSLKVTMDGNKSVTATFVEAAPITYPITVWEKTDDNGIAISWDNNSWPGIQVQTSVSEYSSWQSKLSNVVENDVIKLYVNPVAEGDKSYDVRYWANDDWISLPSLSPNNNVISIPLTSDLANAVKTSGLFITGIRYYLTKVTVEKPKYQLTIVSDGGSVTVKKGEETETTADREFEAGTALTLTATPASGIYTFSKWQMNGTDIDGGTNPTLSTTMDEADMTITAVFTTSVTPQDLGAASTEIKAKTDTQSEQGIVIPCWRFKNASVGDIITINMTAVTEAGTITLKQSDNGWGDLDNSAATDKALAVGTTSFTYALTETSLPLVKANGLYVMGDKFTCTSVTLISAGTVPTSDARTEKYIYNESKTITTEATATIAKERFTNASIGDKLTLTVSSVDNATITLKSGEETIKSESGVSATSYSYTLQSSDITKVQANGLTIAGSGFTLDKVHLLTEGEVTEVSDPVPDFSLDNFEADEGNTYDKTNHILTNTNGWSGMTLSIGNGSTYIGSSLEVRTKEVSKLKILVKYVGGGEKELSESGDPGRRHVVSDIDNTKKIDQVIIQNQESGTLHFTYMALDPATQYELSVTAEDGSVTVKKNDAVTEETFFDANTVLSLEPVAITNFELEKWTIGGATSTDNPLSLTMNEDKVVVAHFKPKGLAENETRNLHTSSGDVIDWNQICEKGASYGALLQAGDVFQITVSALTSGTDNHQVVLRGGSHDEGTSVKATGMVEIVMTADILSNYTSGFSITGTGVTITKVDLFRPKAVSRTERMMNESEVVMDGSNGATVNSGRFANASAYDVLRVYFTNTSGATSTSAEENKMHLILKYNGESDNWDYIKEMRFAGSETQFEIPLTQSVLALLKNNGLQVTGEKFTLKSVSLLTASALGPDTKKNSDEEKKDDEKKGDEEAIIDEKTGEADLNELSAQDDTKTTLTQNEDGSITMTTTEAYQAAQIWFNDPEVVAGNVLKVQLAESSVNVTVTVKYTDGTQSQMSANTMAAKARGAVRAATRADSGTEIEVPLETGKEVQNIEVKNNVAGTITIQKMQVTTINVFTNGVANLSMLKPQSNATYDTSTHTLATTKGWTGATISPVDGETVSGKELLIEFAEAAKVKVAVKYRTDVEGPSIIMEKAAANVRLALDNTKSIQEISIQPTDAAIVTFTKIAVNGEESDDGKLKPGKSITLWENSAGEKLAWNEVAKQGEDIGEMLQEYDELLITVSGVAEDCDWPKVFLRDVNSEQVGNEVLLNDVASFPYTVRIVLTGDMAEQLANGFCVCGDGITVTKLVAYRPEEPKEGDIHLADLNYGYNSSYDKGTHTITTTSRWAARGWEIGDKRYNDKNLIIVKFEPVDFPVTLKMEYTTGVQTAQATSVGVPAGRTELMLEIPQGISKLNRVYLIYEEPGSLRLTEASVVYQDKLKLSTAIQAFEAEGVIRDGRYDTDGWYNLRGMRIQEPKTSGVYIHGGKKVVIY